MLCVTLFRGRYNSLAVMAWTMCGLYSAAGQYGLRGHDTQHLAHQQE